MPSESIRTAANKVEIFNIYYRLNNVNHDYIILCSATCSWLRWRIIPGPHYGGGKKEMEMPTTGWWCTEASAIKGRLRSVSVWWIILCGRLPIIQ